MGDCKLKIKAHPLFDIPSVRKVGLTGSLNSFQFMAPENP